MLVFKKGERPVGDALHIVAYDFDKGGSWYDYNLYGDCFVLIVTNSNDITFSSVNHLNLSSIPTLDDVNDPDWNVFYGTELTIVVEEFNTGLIHLAKYISEYTKEIRSFVEEINNSLSPIFPFHEESYVFSNIINSSIKCPDFNLYNNLVSLVFSNQSVDFEVASITLQEFIDHYKDNLPK